MHEPGPTPDPAACSRTRHDAPPIDWLHASAAAALRHWERRRIAYNAVLALVTGGVFATHWTQFLLQASPDFFLGLFLLAVLANVAFCAAYPADLFLQRAQPTAAPRRARTVLFLVGTAFAAVLAQFVARGMLAGG